MALRPAEKFNQYLLTTRQRAQHWGISACRSRSLRREGTNTEQTSHGQRVWAVQRYDLLPRAKVGTRNKRSFQRGAQAEKDVGGFWFLFISRRDLDWCWQLFPGKDQIKYFRLCRPHSLCRSVVVCYSTKAARLQVNGCAWLGPIQVYLWTLKCEFHVIFMVQEIVFLFFLFSPTI